MFQIKLIKPKKSDLVSDFSSLPEVCFAAEVNSKRQEIVIYLARRRFQRVPGAANDPSHSVNLIRGKISYGVNGAISITYHSKEFKGRERQFDSAEAQCVKDFINGKQEGIEEKINMAADMVKGLG